MGTNAGVECRVVPSLDPLLGLSPSTPSVAGVVHTLSRVVLSIDLTYYAVDSVNKKVHFGLQ